MKFLALLIISLTAAVTAKSIWDWFDDYEHPITWLDIFFEAKRKKPAGYSFPPANSNLNIFALPVGQGDCTVIQCPSAYGGEISIIDAGSSANTGFTKTQVIDAFNGQTVETIILTHPHDDHINYIEDILKVIKGGIPPIYHPCDWNTFYSGTIKSAKIKANATRTGQCCGAGCTSYKICNNNVVLNVIASERKICSTGTPSYKNEASIVTKIEYGGTATLIPGDFEGGVKFTNDFINCAGNLKSDIYRLAHHGSYGNANRDVLLDKIQPEYAFSSSGLSKGGYNHPRCGIRDYLFKQKYLVTKSYHPYTCYDSSTSPPDKTGTTKAIYSTTTIDRKYNNYVNHVIKFSIDSTGTINVRRTNVG